MSASVFFILQHQYHFYLAHSYNVTCHLSHALLSCNAPGWHVCYITTCFLSHVLYCHLLLHCTCPFSTCPFVTRSCVQLLLLKVQRLFYADIPTFISTAFISFLPDLCAHLFCSKATKFITLVCLNPILKRNFYFQICIYLDWDNSF